MIHQSIAPRIWRTGREVVAALREEAANSWSPPDKEANRWGEASIARRPPPVPIVETNFV